MGDTITWDHSKPGSIWTDFKNEVYLSKLYLDKKMYTDGWVYNSIQEVILKGSI